MATLQTREPKIAPGKTYDSRNSRLKAGNLQSLHPVDLAVGEADSAGEATSTLSNRPDAQRLDSESLLLLDRKMRELHLHESNLPKNPHHLPQSPPESISASVSDKHDFLAGSVQGIDAVLAATVAKHVAEQAELTTEKMLADKKIWVKFASDVLCEWRQVENMVSLTTKDRDYARLCDGVKSLDCLVEDVKAEGSYPCALAELMEGLVAFQRLWSECRARFRSDIEYTYGDDLGGDLLHRMRADEVSDYKRGIKHHGTDSNGGTACGSGVYHEDDENMEFIPLSLLRPDIIKVHEIKLDDTMERTTSSNASSPRAPHRLRTRPSPVSGNKPTHTLSPISAKATSSKLISEISALRQDVENLAAAACISRQQEFDVRGLLERELNGFADQLQVLNDKADTTLEWADFLGLQLQQQSLALTDLKATTDRHMIADFVQCDADDYICEEEKSGKDMWSVLWPQGDPDVDESTCQNVDSDVVNIDGIIEVGRGSPSPGFCVVM